MTLDQDSTRDDPTAQLSPTARRLVAAARQERARGRHEAPRGRRQLRRGVVSRAVLVQRHLVVSRFTLLLPPLPRARDVTAPRRHCTGIDFTIQWPQCSVGCTNYT